MNEKIGLYQCIKVSQKQFLKKQEHTDSESVSLKELWSIQLRALHVHFAM